MIFSGNRNNLQMKYSRFASIAARAHPFGSPIGVAAFHHPMMNMRFARLQAQQTAPLSADMALSPQPAASTHDVRRCLVTTR